MNIDQSEWASWQLSMAEKVKPVDDSIEFLTKVRYVAGADISVEGDLTVVAICLFSFPETTLIKEIVRSIPKSDVEYVPGFLGMREAPAVLAVLKELEQETTEIDFHSVQFVLMVDGNGTLHERRFGSACHIGVVGDNITIGVAKTFYCVQELGLTRKEANSVLEGTTKSVHSFDGFHAAAVKTSEDAKIPVFVSVGNRISLESAIEVVKKTSKYRVPDPIRRADFISREFIRNFK
jgi:endonuclease V